MLVYVINLDSWALQAILESGLTDRYQFVRGPDGSSSLRPVVSGVLQGTVSCPLLFLILMHSIDTKVPSDVVSFTDYTRQESTTNSMTYHCDLDNLEIASVTTCHLIH